MSTLCKIDTINTAQPSHVVGPFSAVLGRPDEEQLPRKHQLRNNWVRERGLPPLDLSRPRLHTSSNEPYGPCRALNSRPRLVVLA